MSGSSAEEHALPEEDADDGVEVADRDRRERGGREPADHEGIDGPHEHDAHLHHHHRNGEAQEGNDVGTTGLQHGQSDSLTVGRSDRNAPGWIRTTDPQLRRLMLYPTELRARTGN